MKITYSQVHRSTIPSHYATAFFEITAKCDSGENFTSADFLSAECGSLQYCSRIKYVSQNTVEQVAIFAFAGKPGSSGSASISFRSQNLTASCSIPFATASYRTSLGGATIAPDISSTTSNMYLGFSCSSSPSGLSSQSYVQVSNDKLYGAAWANDYAEYRETSGNLPTAGNCVVELGDDTVSISTQRLQKAGHIVSDTCGFAVGQKTDTSKLIAISGRVLAIPYEDRNEFKAGEAVCTGPNGTISRMSREEMQNHPECIVGWVSAIPDYDIWKNTIPVNNRIWIKVN